MPGMPAVLRRSSWMISPIGWRSARGFSWTNMRPWFSAWLLPLMPTMEFTSSTEGCWRISSATRAWRTVMSSKEASCGPSVPTLSRPVSSTGKKPLGMLTASQTDRPMEARKVSQTMGRKRSALSSSQP